MAREASGGGIEGRFQQEDAALSDTLKAIVAYLMTGKEHQRDLTPTYTLGRSGGTLTITQICHGKGLEAVSSAQDQRGLQGGLLCHKKERQQ